MNPLSFGSTVTSTANQMHEVHFCELARRIARRAGNIFLCAPAEYDRPLSVNAMCLSCIFSSNHLSNPVCPLPRHLPSTPSPLVEASDPACQKPGGSLHTISCPAPAGRILAKSAGPQFAGFGHPWAGTGSSFHQRRECQVRQRCHCFEGKKKERIHGKCGSRHKYNSNRSSQENEGALRKSDVGVRTLLSELVCWVLRRDSVIKLESSVAAWKANRNSCPRWRVKGKTIGWTITHTRRGCRTANLIEPGFLAGLSAQFRHVPQLAKEFAAGESEKAPRRRFGPRQGHAADGF